MKQDLVGQAKEIDAAQDYLDRCLHHLKAGRWLISEQGQGPVLDPGMMEGNCWVANGGVRESWGHRGTQSLQKDAHEPRGDSYPSFSSLLLPSSHDYFSFTGLEWEQQHRRVGHRREGWFWK